MINRILKEFHKNKKLISITTKDIEWDASLIGFIVEIDEIYVTIKELDEYGKFIGNMIYPISDILCVQTDNWYMQNLKIIHENADIFKPDLSVTIWKAGKELIPYFKSTKENEKITRFFFEEDNFVIGLVLDFDDDFLLIKNIGQDGKEEGITYYRINDIIGLRYDGLDEQKIKLLYRKGGVRYCT